ncbi:MAG: putative fluoride ion transporter CrcB [Methanonatronarchaeales archaeon]|nr:putative fluoride ion transporter CrcB [Methanonatronarchaeales archaeon]
MSGEARLLLGVGVLAAFTTFSTFSYETFRLLEEGDAALFLGNVALNVGSCLGAVLLAGSLMIRLSGVSGA